MDQRDIDPNNRLKIESSPKLESKNNSNSNVFELSFEFKDDKCKFQLLPVYNSESESCINPINSLPYENLYLLKKLLFFQSE